MSLLQYFPTNNTQIQYTCLYNNVIDLHVCLQRKNAPHENRNTSGVVIQKLSTSTEQISSASARTSKDKGRFDVPEIKTNQ